MNQPGKPQFDQGHRVTKRGEEQNGRVQQVTYDSAERQFSYMVKWDVGPTSYHLEADLASSPLPPHYP